MSTPRSTFLPPDISRYNYTSPSSFSHGSLNLPPQIGPLNGQLGPVPSLPPSYPRSFDPPRGLTTPSYNPASLNQRVEPFNVPQNMPSWVHSQVPPPNFFSSHMPMSNPIPSFPQSQLPSPALPNYPSPSSAFNSSLHDMVPRSYSFPSTFVPLPLQGFQPRPVGDALMPITFTPSHSLASRQVMKIPSFQPNRIPVRTQDLTYFLNNLDATMREMRNAFPSPEFLIPMRGGLGGVPLVFKLNNYTTLSVDPYAFNKVYQTATPKEKEVIRTQLAPTSRPGVASDSLELVKYLLSDIVHEVYDVFGSGAVNVTGTFESFGRLLPVSFLEVPSREPEALQQRQIAHAKIDAFFNTELTYKYDPDYQPAIRPVMLEVPLPGPALFGRARFIPLKGARVRTVAAGAMDRAVVLQEARPLPKNYLFTNEGWVLPKEGGGTFINGRWYAEHALERMAPRTPQVMAELESRFLARAKVASQKLHPKEFHKWRLENAPNPRGVPPSVVEAEIAQPGSTGVRVILNENGHVITVIPGGQ